MTARLVAWALLKPHPEVHWAGYIPVLIVASLFGLMAIHEGILMAWPYVLIQLVCVLQLKYRTLAGWLLLLILCAVYAIDVLVHPDTNNITEYAFFAICGLLPAAALFISRPRRPFSIPSPIR
jgi:hypothetical protein